MPSTIIIIPAMNIIVDQFIPVDDSSACPVTSQKFGSKKVCRFNVLKIASVLCIDKPNTRSSVSAAPANVIKCRSNISKIIKTNITMKIEIDKI